MFDNKKLYVMEISLRMGFKADCVAEDPIDVVKKYIEKLTKSIKPWYKDLDKSDEKIHDDNYVGPPMLLKVSIDLEETVCNRNI